MDKEQALEYVQTCARFDFDERITDDVPDAHVAVGRWQQRDPRMGAAMSTLGRLGAVMVYQSEYTSAALCVANLERARAEGWKPA